MLNPRLGVTLSIMAGVTLVCVSLGPSVRRVGARAARRLDRQGDRRGCRLPGLMMPSFFVALLFIMVFAVLAALAARHRLRDVFRRIPPAGWRVSSCRSFRVSFPADRQHRQADP